MNIIESDPVYRLVVLVDARTLARLLSVSTRTVWRMASRGEIPQPIRLNERVVRWRLTDIERLVKKATSILPSGKPFSMGNGQ